MDHYIDIRIRPDPELPVTAVLSIVFGRLHRVLVQLESSDIGVSFPEVKGDPPEPGSRPNGLGALLRVHGSLPSLNRLAQQPWLPNVRDHISITNPRPVPEQTQHRAVWRVQAQSSPERVRRRLMKRHGIDEATAAQRIPDTAAQVLRLPYLNLSSGSTGQHFRLFVQHRPLRSTPAGGIFNAYGFSQIATVPWF